MERTRRTSFRPVKYSSQRSLDRLSPGHVYVVHGFGVGVKSFHRSFLKLKIQFYFILFKFLDIS